MNENEEKIELLKKAFEFKSKNKFDEAVISLSAALKLENGTNEKLELHSQLGELYILLGDLDNALKEFQNALSIDRNHKYSAQKCFDIYFNKKQYLKALHLAKEICEKEKNATNYLNYLKTLCELNKFGDVIEIFNSLDENIKLEPDILYLISLVDENKKEALLNRIIDLDDTHQKANLDLAKIAFEKNDFNKVIQCCVSLDENIPEVSYYLGMIDFKRNNPNGAIEHLIYAIKNDNNNNDYYFDLAKIYIDIAYFKEALECLKQSVKYSLVKNKKENLDEKYFLCGWIYFKEKDFQNALLNLNLVSEKSSFYTNSKIIIQAVNIQNQNFSQAKKILEEIYEQQPQNPILLDALALTYKNLKMPNKAIEIYSKALKLHPTSLFYKLELIDLFIDINMYQDAMAQIEQVKTEYSNCANIYNSLARIYFRLKDYKNALDSMEEYLKLDKNNPESYYFKGLILNTTEKFEEAKTSIYRAITLNPDIAKYYHQMAKSYFGLKQYDDAVLYEKEAIELNPDDINFKKFCYEIALKIGNKEQILLFEKQLRRSEKILTNK